MSQPPLASEADRVQEVNAVIKQFDQTKVMMKRMQGLGMGKR